MTSPVTTYRIYFNAAEAAPHVWSVDEGDSMSEILVQWFHLQGPLNMHSRFNPEAPKGSPKAWVEVEGVATFRHGGVVIEPGVQA